MKSSEARYFFGSKCSHRLPPWKRDDYLTGVPPILSRPSPTKSHRIFELEPMVQPMYRFMLPSFDVTKPAPAQFTEKELTEMYKGPLFIAHAKAVFESLDAAVRLVTAGESLRLADVLSDMGRRHVHYGVVPSHYPVVGKALIHTLRTALGESFTRKAEYEWKLVYGVVHSGMQEGAFYEMEDIDDGIVTESAQIAASLRNGGALRQPIVTRTLANMDSFESRPASRGLSSHTSQDQACNL
jgi:hemoglobin-like flavoprotein